MQKKKIFRNFVYKRECMFKSVITCGEDKPVSMLLPSAGDLKGNQDTIFTTSFNTRYCYMITHLCVHNQTAVMYNRYSVLRDCTLENYRNDEKALIFSVITSGKACEILNGQQVEHSEGAVNVGIMSSNSTHIMHLAAGSNFEKVSVMMSETDYRMYNERYPVVFSNFAKYFDAPHPYVGEIDDSNGKILASARDLQNAVFSRSINPYFVEGLIVECLVNYYHGSNEIQLPEKYVTCRKIFQARDILTEQFNNPPTLRELAATVGTNECTLKKVFKEMFSMTVFDYLNDYRMNKAVRLLADESLTIGEVGEMLGFSSQSHFTTAFRKNYGIAPKEYRENNLNPERGSVPLGTPGPNFRVNSAKMMGN